MAPAYDSFPFKDAAHWLVGNIVAPALDSGAIQPINAAITVADFISSPIAKDPIHKLNLLAVAAPANYGDSSIQMFAAGLAGTVPYLVAGEALGAGMRLSGRFAGAEGMTARVFASQHVANVAAAGIYDAIRDPERGESRLGNALGSMAAYSLYEGFNDRFANFKTPARLAGYYAVGAAGGGTNYVVSALLAGQPLDGRTALMNAVEGGAFNIVLPGGQKSTDILANRFDAHFNRSVPVERFARVNGLLGTSPSLDALIKEQPLARFRTNDTGINWVDYHSGTMHAEPEPTSFAHELSHLKSASSQETKSALGEVKGLLSQGEENQAWTKYLEMRGNQEIAARDTEAQVRSELGMQPTKPDGPGGNGWDINSIAHAPAIGSKTYEEIWREQFNRLRDHLGSGIETDFGGIRK